MILETAFADSEITHFGKVDRPLADFCNTIRVPAQPVDATQALNLSAGVSNVKVLRGRSLS